MTEREEIDQYVAEANTLFKMFDLSYEARYFDGNGGQCWPKFCVYNHGIPLLYFVYANLFREGVKHLIDNRQTDDD